MAQDPLLNFDEQLDGCSCQHLMSFGKCLALLEILRCIYGSLVCMKCTAGHNSPISFLYITTLFLSLSSFFSSPFETCHTTILPLLKFLSMKNLLICFIFTLIVLSFTQPVTVIGDRGSMSASMIKGIVIGIHMSHLPLVMLHCAHILCSDTNHHSPLLVYLQDVQSHWTKLETSLRCDT